MIVIELPAGPLLVFGGPYSNKRALDAMRAQADELAIPPERIICTGDVVAYCAEPEETVEAVRAWGIHVIAGNCEESLAAGIDDCGCGFEEGSTCDRLSKGWYPYANQRVSAASRAWMAGLPIQIEARWHGLKLRVLHGSLDRVNEFLFASQTAILDDQLARAGSDVVIAGHSGVPFLHRSGGRTWFNAGVIGMPANDGTPDVWFGLLLPGEADKAMGLASETATGPRIAYRRLGYDHVGAAAALRRSGHANGYARTLITGLWPSLDVLPAEERARTGRALRSRSLGLHGRGQMARAL